MTALKYKVGDKVRIKSLDWYKNNSDLYGYIVLLRKEEEDIAFDPLHAEYCGQIMTISSIVYGSRYIMENDIHESEWTDEMIEELVESIEDKMKELRKMCTISLTDSNYTDKVEVLLNDYEYTEENGKAYFVKKKKEYPKTYCECKDILGLWDIDDTERGYYKTDLIDKLQMLLICRDVYWKIAGEKMVLRKPWEPRWGDGGQKKYIIHNDSGGIKKGVCFFTNTILAFPTEEMRDAFYESFKELIESVKELL